MRSCNHAVRYYSWIGTKHSVLAKLTRAALEYYLQKDYQRAFLDYQIAAEAGCPVRWVSFAPHFLLLKL